MDPLILAVVLGALIGLVMALTGAGGGVMAIPFLVFGLHLPVQQAAPVGLIAARPTAILGAALGLRQGIVRAGRLPPPQDNGISYLKIPINTL